MAAPPGNPPAAMRDARSRARRPRLAGTALPVPFSRALVLVLALTTPHVACSWLGWGEPEVPTQGESEGPPTIYKWVDEHGIPHYTTDRDAIPAPLRDRVRVRPRIAPAPAQPPAPAPPPARAVDPRPEAGAEAAAGTAGEGVEVDREDGGAEQDGTQRDAAGAPAASNGGGAPGPAAEEESWASRNAPQRPLAGDAEGEPRRNAAVARLDGQIAALEKQLMAREEELLALLGTQGEVGAADAATPAVVEEAMLADNPELRSLSTQLPALQRQLRALRARRKALAKDDP